MLWGRTNVKHRLCWFMHSQATTSDVETPFNDTGRPPTRRAPVELCAQDVIEIVETVSIHMYFCHALAGGIYFPGALYATAFCLQPNYRRIESELQNYCELELT